MLNILMWRNSWRIFVGILSLLLTPFLIPDDLTNRLWVGVLLGLLCPLLVLGRRRSLNRSTYALILSSLPRRRRWQLLGLTPSIFVITLWSVMLAKASWRLGIIYLSWGITCVSIADLFDKKKVRIAEAWGWSFVLIAAMGSAPFWGALFFGRTAFSPWIATLCMSAHPVYTGLKSLGRHSLQDPLLYQITQSGLVEVHPLPWWVGTTLLLIISMCCWELTSRSQLKPAT